MHVILSRDILASSRHILSQRLEGVGTSRLSECMAAALGFNTNAALLSFVDKASVSAICMRPWQDDGFFERLERFGMPSPGRETSSAAIKEAFGSTHAVVSKDYLATMTATSRGVFPSEKQRRDSIVDRSPLGVLRALMTAFVHHAQLGRLRPFLEEPVFGFKDGAPLFLLAILQERRDFDRGVADLLIDWLSSEILRKGEVVADEDRWRALIVDAYAPRIDRFFEHVVMTWDVRAGFPEPATRIVRLKRPQRPVAIVDGNSLGPDVGLRSHGGGSTRKELGGVALMACWMAGMDEQGLLRMAARLEAALTGDAQTFENLLRDLGRIVSCSTGFVEAMRKDFASPEMEAVLRSDVVYAAEATEEMRSFLDTYGRLGIMPKVPGTGATREDLDAFRDKAFHSVRFDHDTLEMDFGGAVPHAEAFDLIVKIVDTGHRLYALGALPETERALKDALASGR